MGLLPLKGERDMLTDIRHTPTATEIVRLSTLLEVRRLGQHLRHTLAPASAVLLRHDTGKQLLC